MEDSAKFKNKYCIDSTRCKCWNYANSGYYFVTICTKDKRNYFGKIRDNKIELNGLGKIAEKFWKEIPEHFNFITLDQFVIMPNHIHGILVFNKTYDVNRKLEETYETRQCLVSTTTNAISATDENGRIFHNQGKKTLSSVIGSYKSICSKTIRKYKPDFVWQDSFYDRIIRNEKELEKIREYIINNPVNWRKDEEFRNEDL